VGIRLDSIASGGGHLGGGPGGGLSDLGLKLNYAQADALTFGNGPVVQPAPACPHPLLHWISISLLILPDNKPPSWWPRETGSSEEQYTAKITNGNKAGKIDLGGSVRFDQIPAGTCQFQVSKEFYSKIEKFFKSELPE